MNPVVSRASWWGRRTLRGRITLIGVVGLAAGLAVGGVGLAAALTFVLHRTADADARTTADAVARLVAADALPDPLPVAGHELRVQVIDARGRVRAGSIGADRLVPMLYAAERQRLADGSTARIPGERLGLRGPVRVVAVPAGTPADPQTVLVARSMADISRSVTLFQSALLLLLPLLVAGSAVVISRAVGGALRPVEELRAGAEEITGGAGGERGGHLPVPAARDEIGRLALTLNGMLDRLAAGRARQRAFVADAAHELRSPLANIRTQLEVAQRLGVDSDWPELAEDLLADTRRLGRLVDDLLLLARADEGSDARRAPVGPVELGDLLVEVARRYPAPPVRVVRPDRPLWTVGDPDMLARVLANLLENAVRHAYTDVVVTASGPAGGARYHLVTVIDDGPGVPAADRDRVFDRFTRLDDARARARDAGGAGLGLAIVRELVRQHGGSVILADAAPTPDVVPPAPDVPPGSSVLASTPGPGLRVEVRLPADDECFGHLDGPVVTPPQRPGAAARSVQTGSALPTVSME